LHFTIQVKVPTSLSQVRRNNMLRGARFLVRANIVTGTNFSGSPFDDRRKRGRLVLRPRS